MEQLALNFVPLKCQDFSINVFKKARNVDDPRNEDKSIFSLSLPYDITNNDQIQLYWLSFSEQPEFTSSIYSSKADINLTNRFLFTTLKNHCFEKLVEFSHFKIFINRVTKGIKFILNKYPEGEEVILLKPYYLEYTKEFGFLIDFKFDVKKGQPINRRIQQLSLSLDNEYKSNRNLYYEKFEKLKEFARL